MDLTFFIICLILIYLIYYLIGCIQSLNNELKEVKNKCVHVKQGEELKVNTENIESSLKEKTVTILDLIKKLFNK
jgi:cell division protein YceG involved in septum cleavage|tara:strand:- start:159 stop:383 length:225 start_codon:yes stop_codon:yes gene_type:complete